MPRPSESELALLKAIASSAAFIAGMENLRFVSPYLLEYEGYEPKRLWLPELDFPFKQFVEDTSGDSEHNVGCWNTWHSKGREKPNSTERVSIWQYLEQHRGSPVEKRVSVLVESKEIKFTGTENNEWRIHRSAEGAKTYTVVVATAYQSCGTLFSIMSFLLVPSRTSGEVISKLKGYFEHIKESRYLWFGSELQLPKLEAKQWASLREFVARKSANHWTEERNKDTQWGNYCGCSDEIILPVKRDYGTDRDKAMQADDGNGRPPIHDVLCIDNKPGLVEGVIKRRVTALLRSSNTLFPHDIVTDMQAHDYLWFNALAVADSIASAVIAYGSLTLTHDSDRLWIDQSFKEHERVTSVLRLKRSDDNTWQLLVCIHEVGLVGKNLAISNRGSHIKAICDPAFVAGANEVKVRFLEGMHERTAEIVKSGNDLVVTNKESTTTSSNPMPFTGLWFVIPGCIQRSRLVVCGD